MSGEEYYAEDGFDEQAGGGHEAAQAIQQQLEQMGAQRGDEQQQQQQQYEQQEYHQHSSPLQHSPRQQPQQQQQQQEQRSQPPLLSQFSAPLPSQAFRPPAAAPSFLHSSLSGAAASAAAQHIAAPAAVLPLDPRSTPDYQVAWELELWRRSEVKAQQARWAAEESARMRILEEEFAKGVKAEEAKLQLRIVKVAQAEKAAQQAVQELEKGRAALRLQQTELASRVASLDKELSKHKGDADAFVARMKDQTAYEVGKARQQLKDAQAQIDLLKKELKSTQAKLAESREEHEKDKLKHAKSNFGAVESALHKTREELGVMAARLVKAEAEREHEKARLAAALQKGMALFQQIETLKAEQLENKSRDADVLRAQYLAKERQVGAQRSVAEAHEIMKAVKGHLREMTIVPPAVQPAFGSASLGHSQGGPSSGFQRNSQSVPQPYQFFAQN